MTGLVRLSRTDGEVADVRPEWVDEWMSNGWTPPVSVATAIPDDWQTQHWAKQVQIAEALSGADLLPAEGETKADAARRVIGEHLAAQGL